MTPEARLKLRELLVKQEGYKQFCYVDTTGHNTIGFGRNLDKVGVSLDEALAMLSRDMNDHYFACSRQLDFFDSLSENRQIVLVNMSFNIGFNSLREFHQMIAALERHDYNAAADAMLDSRWAKQTNQRADILANIMRTGEI